MRESDYLVIGAGIAGASCAHWLSAEHRVTLLEMESQPGYHTTGRSVAVYTEAYGPRVIRALAIAGREFFRSPPAGFTEPPLCHPQDLLFIARPDQMDSLHRSLAAVGELSPGIREMAVDETVARVPVLRRGYLGGAFVDPNAMALDVAAIHQGYLRGCRRNGAEVVCDAEVLGMERAEGSWRVRTRAGDFEAAVVVNAAGAWADHVAALAGARPVGLQPKRRTVIAFAPPAGTADTPWPVVIDCDEQFYFKLDAGLVLGSPADETPVPAQDAQPEDEDVAITVDRIERATTMTVTRITRKWAGLRSFVADGVPVVGHAPDREGFFWCAGQGGYGIETSVGMGRTSAALAAGGSVPEDVAALGVTADDLAPARLWRR